MYIAQWMRNKSIQVLGKIAQKNQNKMFIFDIDSKIIKC